MYMIGTEESNNKNMRINSHSERPKNLNPRVSEEASSFVHKKIRQPV